MVVEVFVVYLTSTLSYTRRQTFIDHQKCLLFVAGVTDLGLILSTVYATTVALNCELSVCCGSKGGSKGILLALYPSLLLLTFNTVL
jgi:hypothetical protein